MQFSLSIDFCRTPTVYQERQRPQASVKISLKELPSIKKLGLLQLELDI